MSSEKKQGERLDARSKMEQSIRDYIAIAQVCDMSERYIAEDIIDVVFDASEGSVKLHH